MRPLVVDRPRGLQVMLRDKLAPVVDEEPAAAFFISDGFGDKIRGNGILGPFVGYGERGWNLARTHLVLVRIEQSPARKRGQVFFFFLEKERRRDVRPRVPLPVDVGVEPLYQPEQMRPVLHPSVIGREPLREFVGHLVLPLRLRRPDPAQPQLDPEILEELGHRRMDGSPSAAVDRDDCGHIVREDLPRHAAEPLEGVDQASLEVGLLLEFRVLEVMQPRVSEGGAEEIELERLSLRGRKPHRLHPVHLQLLAGIRLVKGVRDGRLGLPRDPLGFRESLEIVVRAPYPPLVPEEPVRGFHARPGAGEQSRHLLDVGVELRRPPLPRFPPFPFVHLLDCVPVPAEGPGKLTEI